jgi:hypothetical protein
MTHEVRLLTLKVINLLLEAINMLLGACEDGALCLAIICALAGEL